MRNVLRRIAFGVLGTGVIAAMATGTTTVAVAADAAPLHAAAVPAAEMDWPTVSRGAEGNRVRTIQYLLNQHKFVVEVDGYFGKLTMDAVAAFQKKYKVTLDPSGVVGAYTWGRLIVDLYKGKKGVADAVRALQSYLKHAYKYDVPVTGTFGDKTEKAVKDFQVRHKFSYPSGRVGIATWYVMLRDAR